MAEEQKHEVAEFKRCAFGDGGFHYHDGAERIICSCGWTSAAVQDDRQALVAIWKIHHDEHVSREVSEEPALVAS